MSQTEEERRLHQFASIWVGTPHRDRMAKAGVGVDCVNLVIEAIIHIGKVPRPTALPSYDSRVGIHEESERLASCIAAAVHCEEVAHTATEAGDIFVCRTGKAASHCGIFVDRDTILHAVARRHVKCEPALRWRGRMAKIYRMSEPGWRRMPAAVLKSNS